MVNDNYQKTVPAFIKNNLVQSSFQFLIPVIIGIIYGFMINDETIRGYMNQILPSQAGPDLHQYLPLVIAVLVYTYFIQKHRSLLKKTIFICLHIFIAILSFIASFVVLLVI